jgi:ribosome biogenesis GTPase
LDLTRRQKWRIKKIQQERIKRAHKAGQTFDELPLDENKVQTGRVITRYGQRLLIEDTEQNRYQCTTRQNIAPAVAGDLVVFQPIDEHEGIVSALLDRNNELKRAHKLIAANVDTLWLVVAMEPHYQFELIDRYLIMAENTQLPINIIVNKIELTNNQKKVENDFSMYIKAGYAVHFLSVKSQSNLSFFKSSLQNKTHIFLGQSGVGKSSLVNYLLPNLDLRVNELSAKSKLGKHTTTNTTLYHIPSGGDLIDSPGVREFQLDNLTQQEVTQGFREFSPLKGLCKFRNCKHLHEPNCAIKQALKDGKIHLKRYESYQKIIETFDSN